MRTDNTIAELQLEIDRLVDGELPDERRRALIVQLENYPDQWRTCALAYIEADSLKQDLKRLRGAVDPHRAPQATVARPAASRGRLLPGWLALAAAVLVSFALGIVLQASVSPRNQRPAVDQIAGTPVPGSSESADQRPTAAGQETPDATSLAGFSSNLPEVAISPVTANSREQLVVMVDGKDGKPRPIRVPLVDVEGQRGTQLAAGESAFPEHVLRYLEDRGHRVERRQRVAPVPLQDGREMLVPVEDIKITPVSRHIY